MARKGLNQEKIIEVAVKLVEEQGFNHLNLTELADMLHIKPASIYNHFHNIDDIACGVGIFAVDKIRQTLAEAIMGKYRAEAIFTLADAYRQFGKEHPQLYKAFIAFHVANDPAAGKHIHAVVELIFAAMAEFALTEEQRIHWERTLRSTMHGFTAYEEAGWFRKLPADLNDSYSLAIRNIVASIEAMERMNRLQGNK